jgi:F-type H+-transporting ATPase subunit delta
MKGSAKALQHSCALALWSEASVSGREAETEAELARTARALRASPELRQLLLHPGLTQERKAALLKEAVGAGESVAMLLRVLADRSALGLASGVYRAYRAVRIGMSREAPVKVVSAVPLKKDETEELKAVLERSLGRPVRLELSARRELLGGLLVEVGERRIDGTVKGAFDRLEREMLVGGMSVSGGRPESGGRRRASIGRSKAGRRRAGGRPRTIGKRDQSKHDQSKRGQGRRGPRRRR